QMQVVVRDSGQRQPRDAGWLGAEQRWTVGSLATSVAFVSSGLGFAWLPQHMIERELAEGILKPLPLIQGSIRRPQFYLYTNPDKPLRPASRIHIELIKTYDTQSPSALGSLAQTSNTSMNTPCNDSYSPPVHCCSPVICWLRKTLAYC